MSMPALCCICGAPAESANYRIGNWESRGYYFFRKTTTTTLAVPACVECTKKLKIAIRQRKLIGIITIVFFALLCYFACLYIGLAADVSLFGAFLGGFIGLPFRGLADRLFNRRKVRGAPIYQNGFYVFFNKQFFEAFSKMDESIAKEYRRLPEKESR